MWVHNDRPSTWNNIQSFVIFSVRILSHAINACATLTLFLKLRNQRDGYGGKLMLKDLYKHLFVLKNGSPNLYSFGTLLTKPNLHTLRCKCLW